MMSSDCCLTEPQDPVTKFMINEEKETLRIIPQISPSLRF